MRSSTEKAVLGRLYWWAFAARGGVGLLAWLLSEIYGASLMEDAGGYSRLAGDLARSWLTGVQPSWFSEYMESGKSAWFMVGVLACFYCLTGGYEAIPIAIFVQCLLTSFTPVLAYRAARRLGVPPDGALFTGRLIAFSPAFVFWAGALYKEGLILFALFLITEHVLRLQQQFRPGSAVVLGLAMVAMFGLRFYIAAILSVTIVVSLLFGRRHAKDADPLSAGVRQILVLVLMATIFSLFGISNQVAHLASGDVESNLAQINRSRRDLASYNSGYAADADVSTAEGALQFLPVGMAYFLTVPLPWHFGSIRQNLVIAETATWIVLIYPLAYRGALRGARANPQGVLFLVLSSVTICCFYAIFVGNIGTAYRLRVQVWALWSLLAGWGYAMRRGSVRRPCAAAVRVWTGPSPAGPVASGPPPSPTLLNGERVQLESRGDHHPNGVGPGSSPDVRGAGSPGNG